MPLFGPPATILNVFIAWASSAVGFVLCLYLKKSGRKDKLASSAFFLWLAISSAYSLMALGSFFTWFGYLKIEKIIDYFMHSFIQLSFIPAAYYASFKVFQNSKLSKHIAVVFFIIFLVFLFQLIRYGVVAANKEVTYYGINFIPHFKAEIILVISFVPLPLFGFYDLFRRLAGWFFKNKPFELHKFLATFFLVLLALAAGLNQIGWIVNIWALIITRIIIFAIFLLSFISFLNEEKSSEEGELVV